LEHAFSVVDRAASRISDPTRAASGGDGRFLLEPSRREHAAQPLGMLEDHSKSAPQCARRCTAIADEFEHSNSRSNIVIAIAEIVADFARAPRSGGSKHA
jgi:hypothetical protein